MIERGGYLVICLLENVKQTTIKPIIGGTVSQGSLICTDEYDIYARLEEWGYTHRTVCHSAGEYARDDDGDGFCEIHVIQAITHQMDNAELDLGLRVRVNRLNRFRKAG